MKKVFASRALKALAVFAGTLLVVTAALLRLEAGGPLAVQLGGVIVKWDTDQPVEMVLDQGGLGPVTADEAVELIQTVIGRWNAVETSTIQLASNRFLDQDITGTNVTGFLQTFFGPSGDPIVRPGNPVIFDADGSVTDTLLGNGMKAFVLGFFSVRNTIGNRFNAGFLVLNGTKASTERRFQNTVGHEIGHLLGLDHSQGLLENRKLGFRQLMPLMFPTNLGSDATPVPLGDDRAWLSWLYPSADFRTATGTIKGKALRRGGAPLFNANVVARPVTVNEDGSLVESRDNVVTAVSDFALTGDGTFELPGLEPGTYVVFIEPVLSSFTGGSGVGPRDSRFTRFPRDHFDAAESGDPSLDDPAEKTVIEVAAGEVVEGIDLIANEEFNRLDFLTDDDSMTWVFADGFTFPFFGQIYDRVQVNSDGNLTFGTGDVAITARNESRFLSGPPRIAPLFTDLNPSGSGAEVVAEEGDGFVRFNWVQVPEFGTGPSSNSFSVTLFSTADIVFSYDEVNVTPDSLSPGQDVQAIVGVTPGGGAAGQSADLSDLGFSAALGVLPVYEVFLGESFDLSGQDFLFRAGSSEIFFPFFQGSVNDFTGFAFTNFSDGAAGIQLESRRDDGELQAGNRNPRTLTVESDTQLARLEPEIFEADGSVPRAGWVGLLSNRAELASFFQFGRLVGRSLKRMDGASALAEKLQMFYFTRILHGAAVFETQGGAKDAATTLSIANPNREAVELTLRLFNPFGQLWAVAERNLPALGRLFEDIEQLFGLPNVSDAYIEVEVDGPGAVGFALVELPDAVFGLNGVPLEAGDRAFSAQLGHGDSIFTRLKVVNPGEALVNLILTAFIQDPLTQNISERVVPIPLQPGQSEDRGVEDWFGLFAPSNQSIVGSIQIEAAGGPIIGDVVFGDPLTADFAAALPLETKPFSKAIFSHVANGPPNPNPSLDLFTGLAVFNPNDETATVTVEVFDRDGNLLGSTVKILGAKRRFSEQLEELVPESADLAGGYVVVTSTLPVVAQELFANNTLEFLSAVPPHRVQ